ncbi:MAG: ATP F0F1 synthase subunit B [Hyphomicrobiales bacterium]|nr:MAG: ATP F0F1 synthase subunit B [Hyphomicrobiales bacterium]
MRIEDTDRKRSTDEAVDAIFDGLSWLGLDADGDIIHQYARRDRHAEIAQQLLAEYQRKRKEAEQEAGEIVAAAKREALAMTKDAERKTEEYVVRRAAMAEQKIAQAESQAIAEVRATAVDVSIEAAEALIGKKMTAATASNLFKKGLAEVRTRMN